MSIYDELKDWEDNNPDTDENIYFDDSSKSIELIASLLKYGGSKENQKMQQRIHRLNELMDKDLLFSLKSVDLKDELKLYQKMLSLSNKLKEQNRLVLLKDKVVVGVGGKFSAGKSCFINSILGEQILPENQDETTSIATYIIKGAKRVNYAYTRNNQKIELDDAAVNALCHEFKRMYGIGFAGFISNIVIQVKNFPYPNVILLDTPGYSKDDNGTLQELADETKAREQLQAIDYLIWTIDAANGEIQGRDLEFIKGLKVETPMLVVVNKADKKPESHVRKIVDKAKRSLDDARLPYFDVIAYDSKGGTEYLENDGLKRFFNMVNSSEKINEDIVKEIHLLIEQILNQLQVRKSDCINQVKKLNNVISRSTDSMEIQGLVEIYSDLQGEIRDLSECIDSVNQNKEQIDLYVEQIGL